MTADMGIRGFGPTPAKAFEQAALAMTAVANVACRPRYRIPQFRGSSLPCFMQVSLGHAQRFTSAQRVPSLRIPS